MKPSIKIVPIIGPSLDFNDDNRVYFNDVRTIVLEIFGNIHNILYMQKILIRIQFRCTALFIAGYLRNYFI